MENNLPHIEDEKEWEKTQNAIVALLERTIGEKEWDFFEQEASLQNLADQFHCRDNGQFYWLEEKWRMYQRIAQHRSLNSDRRRESYYRKTAKGNERLHHVVESQQFSPEEIEAYCSLALLLKKYDQFVTDISNLERDEHDIPPDVLAIQQQIRNSMLKLLKGKRIINLFIQPSSRTHRSFDAAELMLGASVVDEKDPSMSSMAKGETGPDTIRTFAQYYHAIVQRAPSNYATEEAILAQNLSKNEIPIINAGSGTRQHPTQALLDVATIKESLGLQQLSELNGKTVTIIGDLLYGRTVRSLIYTLSIVAPQVKFRLVSPQQLRIPETFRKHLGEKKIHVEEMEDMNAAIQGADVIYVTRVQQEWFKQNNQMQLYYDIKDKYLIREEHFDLLSPGSVVVDDPETTKEEESDEQKVAVMHPLPRKNELSWKTDHHPQSRIWEEVKNGMYMRAALLLAIFGKVKEFLQMAEEYNIDKLDRPQGKDVEGQVV